MSTIPDSQIKEWTENPVTLELKKKVEAFLAVLDAKLPSDYLSYFTPQKTHEALLKADVIAGMTATFAGALDGDWDYFEGEEIEQVGD